MTLALHRFLGALVPLALATVPASGQSTVRTVFGDSAGDQLGLAVAGVGDVDGDGVRDYAIGAPFDDDSGTSAGRVRVYSGASGAVLYTFFGDAPGDELGRSVAGAGDVNRDGFADVIAGAPGSDNNGTNSGQAKIFSGQDGSVLYSFNGPASHAFFGWSVSTAGDVNQDSHADVVIGAGSTQASAWVHSGANGQVLYNFSGDSCCDRFGWSVHGGADFNRDGWPDVVVGAPLDDNNGNDSGMARVYSGRDGSVLFQANGDAAGDQLGWAVALVGDVNGDTNADVALGSPTNDAAGRLRVVSGASLATLFVVDGFAAGDWLGAAVAPAGDVDGDGLPDVLVGAPFADVAGADAGAMLAVSGLDGTVLALVRGSAAGDELGTAVGVVGDLTGDGRVEAIVGAPRDDDFGADSGSARIVDLFVDCNGNGVHDGAELVAGADADCNGNLVLDSCDVAGGTSADCNANGVPDECDLAGGLPDCNANGVPDECDVLFGTSTDCDANGAPDECQVPQPIFQAASPTLGPFHAGSPQSWVLPASLPASGDVTFELATLADLDLPYELVTVQVDGVPLGDVYVTGGIQCPGAPQSAQLVVPAAVYNAALAGGAATVTLVASPDVNDLCAGSSVQVTVTYAYSQPDDCNANGVPDSCDVVGGTSQDMNGNGLPDECEFETYCVAAPNSTGAAAGMAWAGSNSVSADDLLLIAFPLPAIVNGLFIYAAAPGYTPLGNGFLCLDPSVQGFINRLPFETSNGAGTMTHALDLSAPPTPESLITAGSTWYFSCWFRDPPAGGAGFNFSNGLRVLFVP